MTDQSHTRRNVLKAAPMIALAPSAAIASATGQDTPPSPVQEKFAEWATMFDSLHNAPPMTDDECDAGNERLHLVERELMSLPCESALDALRKITAYTAFGMYGFDSRPEHVSLWEEAKAYLGVDFQSYWGTA